jgi:hypothetical protein
MIDYVKERAVHDFQLQHIELVDVDQLIRPSENGTALLPEDISISQKYGHKLNHLAFYIRPIDAMSTEQVIRDCVICHDCENTEPRSYYLCQHLLCDICILNSVQHGLYRCPICRSRRRNEH